MKRKSVNSAQKDIVIRDWSHLCEQVFHYRKNGHWIFRGVGDQVHPLVPSIGRPNNRKVIANGSPLGHDREGEKLMIEYFIRAAPPYLKHTPKSKLEWLAVAQHHGMFTRLLDWSESLLVAAFFAVKHAVGNSTPVIYAVKDVPIASKKYHDQFSRLPDVDLPPVAIPIIWQEVRLQG